MFLLFSFWHSYDLDVGRFGDAPEVPQPILAFLSSCFFLLVWLDVYLFLMFQLVDLNPSFFLFSVGFLWVIVYFTYYFIFLLHSMTSLSILITSVLNSASDRLAISNLLSSFLWGFVQFNHFSLSPQFSSLPVCFCVLGRAAFTPCLSNTALCQKDTC